jgi:hypothetical protein
MIGECCISRLTVVGRDYWDGDFGNGVFNDGLLCTKTYNLQLSSVCHNRQHVRIFGHIRTKHRPYPYRTAQSDPKLHASLPFKFPSEK